MLDTVASYCPISLCMSILLGAACLLAFLEQFVSWNGTVQRTENGSQASDSLPSCIVFPMNSSVVVLYGWSVTGLSER